MSYKQSKCVFLLCSSLELSSLYIYDHLLMTFLSRNYTREQMSSFLLQWLSRGAARVSGVCFALFSSATDARERFPCEEQWPALKCKSPQRPRCFGKQNPRTGFAGTSRLECTRMRKTRPVEVTNTSISAINLFLICLLTLSWKNKYLYHKKGYGRRGIASQNA